MQHIFQPVKHDHDTVNPVHLAHPYWNPVKSQTVTHPFAACIHTS